MHRLNDKFKSNISIEGYKIPFTTGSKFSAEDNLNTTECEDLIEISGSFEAIWVEINMYKTENIICGCVYRHPNTDSSPSLRTTFQNA